MLYDRGERSRTVTILRPHASTHRPSSELSADTPGASAALAAAEASDGTGRDWTSAPDAREKICGMGYGDETVTASAAARALSSAVGVK